jgi:hypothetical protein
VRYACLAGMGNILLWIVAIVSPVLGVSDLRNHHHILRWKSARVSIAARTVLNYLGYSA